MSLIMVLLKSSGISSSAVGIGASTTILSSLVSSRTELLVFSLAEAFAVFSFCALFVMLITLYLSLMLSRFAGYCDDVSLLCEFVVPDFFFFFLLLACLMLPEPPVGFESSGFVLSEAAFCT